MSIPLPVLDCMCASFRRSARALTQLYDEALRPLDLRVTQFTILQALARAGEVTQGQLGEILVMDSTSLTRTLKIMAGHGWIAERRGEDRRERRLRLSKAGAAQLKRALPVWEEAQVRLRGQIGEAAWSQLMRSANEVARIAQEINESAAGRSGSGRTDR
jgi:DNA-binding MarR family transcriptional regulator